MRRGRVVIGIVGLAVVSVLGYSAYAGYEGSRILVEAVPTGDCRTPAVQYGWPYQAINYDIADDAVLAARNPDLEACTYEGAKAGDEIVTEDGVRIAGWYIPAANGTGPDGPTIVLVPGHHANKSGILHYAEGLHETFNLVDIDLRNTGRSTGDATTAGVFEQRDLRAVLDWLVRTRHPSHIGVLGNSLGAVTALSEATADPRVEALVLDSMHTRMQYQVERRLEQAGHPAYPGTWAIFVGTWLRTGADIGSIDADRELLLLPARPVLLTHGAADTQDLPARTQALFDAAAEAGLPIELRWCPDSGHEAPAGMPAEVCREAFGGWVRDFFTRAFAA